MSATSEPQVLAPKLNNRQLLGLLQQLVAEEPCPYSFIHKEDAYSAAPADLVSRREHAPGTDRGDGKGRKWYFFSPARFGESAHGGPTQRRQRAIPGGTWHPEDGNMAVLDAGGRTAGYRRTLSYVRMTTIFNPSGTKSLKRLRLGWKMNEYSLADGADQLVLCVVYQSPRKATETITRAVVEDHGVAASSGASEGGAIQDEWLHLQWLENWLEIDLDLALDDIPCPELPPASCDYSPCPGVPAPEHQPLCRLGGEILSTTTTTGFAIVKKVNAATVAARVVMKFGTSSILSAERMEEMAKLVLSYPAESGQIVAVVLSEMEDTTNNIFLAVRKALACTNQKASEIHEFGIIKHMYFRRIDELGLDRSIVSGPLDDLENHLGNIAMNKELTTRTREYLLFFGECTTTKIFFGLLNKLGKATLQEWELRDVTIMACSGSELTAITIGRELGSTEIQIWKDVDGVFTCDPKVCEKAILVPFLTFDEAAELMYFGEQSMQLAMEGGAISVIVKNSCNPQARGTVINKTGCMSKSIVTSIVLKSNIIMLAVQRIHMVSQDAFEEKGLSIYKNLKYLGISVDCEVTNEGKMSFALFPSKRLSQELIQLELDNAVAELTKYASVDVLQHRSVISLIGNAPMAAWYLETALSVVRGINAEVLKVSQGSSKVMKYSLVVHDEKAKSCVQALHSAFFENALVPEVDEMEIECPIRESPIIEMPILENLCVAGSSGFKRKAEASSLGESRDFVDMNPIKRALFSNKDSVEASPVQCGGGGGSCRGYDDNGYGDGGYGDGSYGYGYGYGSDVYRSGIVDLIVCQEGGLIICRGGYADFTMSVM